MTGAKVLEYVEQMMRDGTCPLSEADLDAMDAAQATPRSSPSKWPQ
jgi:transcription initiation factor IIE alpha subunit